MNRELITYTNPKSPVSEMFKTLRTNIQFMNTNKQLKTLLVSSTLPGEGKSWTAANLAVTFAQAGKRVLVVDADMRKGRQFNIFGVSPTPGLSNYLSGISYDGSDDVTLDDVIQETEIENLYVLAAGNVPPNPSELLISEKMLDLYDIVKRNFDMTIFDGTPSLIVTDAPILARIVDSTILVTAHNETKIDDVTKVKKAIENIGGKVAGVVVNKIPTSSKKYENTYYYGSSMPAVIKDKKRKRKDFVFEEPKAFRKNKKKEKRDIDIDREKEWNYQEEDDDNTTFSNAITDTIDTTEITNTINKTDTIDTTEITEAVNAVEETNTVDAVETVDTAEVNDSTETVDTNEAVDVVETVEVNDDVDTTETVDINEASIEEKIKENWNKIEQELSVENDENNNTETTENWQENNNDNNQWSPITDEKNNQVEEPAAAEPILSWETNTTTETNNDNIYKSFNDVNNNYVVNNNYDVDNQNPDSNDPLNTQDIINQINQYLEQERSKLKNGGQND